MIVGQNALLNQYVPTFRIKNLAHGQRLVYDSNCRAFVNIGCCDHYPHCGCHHQHHGGATRLGQLTDVIDTVSDPVSVKNNQALIYNSSLGLWENKFIDYTMIANFPNTTLTGDVLGSGTSVIPTILATVNSDVGTFGSATSVPQITVDAKGRITGVTNIPITGGGGGGVTQIIAGTNITISPVSGTGAVTINSIGGGGSGVTSVNSIGTDGVSVSVTNPTTTPLITIGLGDITPDSIQSSGSILASNLSGTNTGDQFIVLSGDATNSDTSTGGVLTLATVNATPGIYGDSHMVPTITVNAKGLVTEITTQHVDTSVLDFVDTIETITIAPRHQYIVTSEMQVDGYLINYGVLAIL